MKILQEKLLESNRNDGSSIDLYSYIYQDGSIGICNETYLNNNNLWDQVYSEVFVGSIDGENIMFIDKKFSVELEDKEVGYTVAGYRVEIQMQEPIIITNTGGEKITINKSFIKVPE